jgi:hypothetical protein
MKTVHARAAAREHNRADLQPLLGAAGLHEAKIQPPPRRAPFTATFERFGDVARVQDKLEDATHVCGDTPIDFQEAGSGRPQQHTIPVGARWAASVRPSRRRWKSPRQ